MTDILRPVLEANLVMIRDAGTLHVSRAGRRAMPAAQQEAIKEAMSKGWLSYWRPGFTDGYSFRLHKNGQEALEAHAAAQMKMARMKMTGVEQERQSRYLAEALF